MSRPRKMTTEQMISVVDSYYLTQSEGNEKRLKCSLIAAFSVQLGYRAEGYDFARNMEVREHIELMKCHAQIQAENHMSEPITVYKNLDVQGFIRNNREPNKLAQALTELDAYWKRIYDHAEIAIAKNKSLMKEKTTAEAVMREAAAQVEALSTEKADISRENNGLIKENRYLRKMLRTYLYPAVANEILIKEKALKEADTDVTEAAVMDMTEFSAPQSLREAVAGDVEIQSEEEQLLSKMWEMCDE